MSDRFVWSEALQTNYIYGRMIDLYDVKLMSHEKLYVYEFIERFIGRMNVGDEVLCAWPITITCVVNDQIDLRIRYNVNITIHRPWNKLVQEWLMVRAEKKNPM